MAKLVGLTVGIGAALQVPGSRVRTAASELRKHKLLKTGPRGPGAPDMGPDDAAALLLGVMYDDELSGVAQNVQRLWDAPLVSSRADRRGDSASEVPPHTLFRTPQGDMASLGGALTSMLRQLVETGDLCEDDIPDDQHLEVFNLTLSVTAPGHQATIRFNNFDALWYLTYQWKSAEQLAYEAEPVEGINLKTRWDALSGPHMSSSRVVGEDSLRLLAGSLGGPRSEAVHDSAEAGALTV